jgi:hypothetical protein
MSIQRAKANCKRCYEIAGLSKRNYAENDQLYGAKNDTMVALEGAIESIDHLPQDERYNESHTVHNPKLASERSKLVQGLNICLGCDFSKPNIFNFDFASLKTSENK